MGKHTHNANTWIIFWKLATDETTDVFTYHFLQIYDFQKQAIFNMQFVILLYSRLSITRTLDISDFGPIPTDLGLGRVYTTFSIKLDQGILSPRCLTRRIGGG